MALTEVYVLPTSAGLADGTSWANAFDLAGAMAYSVGKVGQRYNLKGAFGTITANTWTPGTYQNPNIWRGCSSNIGDLDNQKRNLDGTINTTGMPTITLAGNVVQTYGTGHIILQNINYTADYNGFMTSNGNDDSVTWINCRFENVNTGANARIMNFDNYMVFINCDFICNLSTHTVPIGTMDASCTFTSCRFEATGATSTDMIGLNATCRFEKCVFIGNGSNDAFLQDNATTIISSFVCDNTFYNLGTCWRCLNTHTAGRLFFYNNLIVDCLYPVRFTDATSPMLIQFNNRIVNTTNPSTVGGTADIVEFNNNTTAGDDFVDAPSGNLHLLSTSPAVNAALDYGNLGALDLIPSGSGGVYNPFIQQRVR